MVVPATGTLDSYTFTVPPEMHSVQHPSHLLQEWMNLLLISSALPRSNANLKPQKKIICEFSLLLTNKGLKTKDEPHSYWTSSGRSEMPTHCVLLLHKGRKDWKAASSHGACADQAKYLCVFLPDCKLFWAETICSLTLWCASTLKQAPKETNVM